MSIENRLRKLEEAAGPPMPIVKTFVCDGIEPDDAIRAAGYDPEDPAYFFIAVCIVDPPPYRN